VNLWSSVNGQRELDDIAVARDGQTLRLTGALDATTVRQFRPVVDQLLEDDCRHAVLDVGGLRLIDSVGVGAIIYLYRQMMARGGTLSLLDPNGQPLAILRLMKLDRLLTGGEDLQQLSG
jgi:anti-anti-sigma factor